VSDDTRRRVVVTGGAGFLGSWVCERLIESGVRVVCVDDFSTGVRGNLAAVADSASFELVKCDVSTEIPVSGRVDAVLHLASPASPIDYHRMPLGTLRVGSFGTWNALELARQNDARFVLASTSEVYGDPLVHPQPETYWGNVNPVGPRSVYDEAKRFSEALTTAYRTAKNVNTGIVRIFNTYGPRMRADDGRAIPAFLSQALRDEPLTVTGDGSQTRSICFVDDTVAGILAMARCEEAGPVNIGNPEEMTMLELAERIQRLTGSASPIRFVDLPTDDPKRRCPDISRALDRLGWTPQVSSHDGLTRTLEWYVAQGPTG
jgi:dTDP-glucose 4,6-dehydratase